MPIREWHLRIFDMLECIEKIRSYTAGMDHISFAKDDRTVDAVIRNIEIIGEAARHVPKRITEKYPAVRWIDIRGMRNVLAHAYFGVDMNIVWRVVTGDLPELERQLKNLRADEGI